MLRDVESGKPVTAHAGSVAYNAFRRRYVMIAEESEGSTSNLGEIWYAEADTPLGPWVYARKVVTHDKYSFYNPRHHPMFDQEGGRRIFFEGTYSATFSGVEEPTPLYDYNQIMYQLELDDAPLVLPVPVYAQENGGQQALSTGTPKGRIAFLAPDRPRDDLVALGPSPDGNGRLRPGASSDVVFYAWPPDVEPKPAATVALYAWQDASTGRYWYGVQGQAGPAGFERADKPLGRVWRYPSTAEIRWE